MVKSLLLSASALLGIFSTGCAAETDALDAPTEGNVRVTQQRVIVEPGAKSFVDTKGREWTLLRKIEKSPPSADAAHKPIVEDEVRMADLTDEELAESLRLVTVVGDYMYIEAFVDVNRAKDARARARTAPVEKVTDSFVGAAHDGRAVIDAALKSGTPVRPLDPFLPLRDSDALESSGAWSASKAWDPARRERTWAATALFEKLGGQGAAPPDHTRQIIGGDERMLPAWWGVMGAWPYRTAMSLAHWVGYWQIYSDCSAQLIGQRTAMSAAHCFVQLGNPNASPPTYDTILGPYFAVTSLYTRDAGSGVLQQGIGTSGISDCFRIYANSGYVNGVNGVGRGSPDWDMAVLDFGDPINGCNFQPGYWEGYLGTAWGEWYDYYNNEASMDAYDQFTQFDSQGRYAPYTSPTIMTRPAYTNYLYMYANDYSLLVSSAYNAPPGMDATPGASGGAARSILRKRFGDYTWYNVGVHSGWVSYNPPQNYPGGCGSLCNNWRRADSLYWAFVVNSSLSEY